MGGGASAAKYDLGTKSACKLALRGANTVKDKEEKIVQSFMDWDADGNGLISVAELTLVMKKLDETFTEKDCKKLVQGVDKNKDGALDYAECVSWLTAAPYLPKYFETSNSIVKAFMKEIGNIMKPLMKKMEKDPFAALGEMMAIGPKILALEPKYAAKYRAQLTPIIKKSFAHHDKNNNGVLERDESILFFSNYVMYLEPNLVAVMEAASSQVVCMCPGIGDPKKVTEGYRSVAQQMVKSYKEDEENKVRAAFKILDVNQDECLQESEVLDALIPGSPKNQAFMQAMGLAVTPETIQALAACQPDAQQGCDMDADCEPQ